MGGAEDWRGLQTGMEHLKKSATSPKESEVTVTSINTTRGFEGQSNGLMCFMQPNHASVNTHTQTYIYIRTEKDLCAENFELAQQKVQGQNKQGELQRSQGERFKQSQN